MVDYTSNNNIGSTAMVAFVSFSIIYFIIGVSNHWDIKIYLIFFWVISFFIQFGMNLSANSLLCPKSPNISVAFGYTLLPWTIILGFASILLYVIPGWVRVFSNTIGLAAAKSMYYEILKKDMPNPTENKDLNIVISKIYADPSQLINEVEYNSDYKIWVETIYTKYLKERPFFNNKAFVESLISLFDTDTKEPNDNDLYKLYKLIALKEKIGYFIWIFLIGIISVLISLNQVLSASADCIQEPTS